MGEMSDVSVRAREAEMRFRHPFAPEEMIESWRTSVSVYFAEFKKAVDDRARPVPLAYFESGYSLATNPIFAILDPKPLSEVLRHLEQVGPDMVARLEHEVFNPYVRAWEESVKAILTRVPESVGEVTKFSSRLQAYLGAIRMMASVAGSRHDGTFARTFDLFSELCAAFRDVGARVAGAEMLNHVDAGAEQMPQNRRERRRYERFCLPSERLAEMFDVSRETITRWKTADTEWASRFRLAKNSLAEMERLAREYRAVGNVVRERRVSFNENIHGVVSARRPNF